MTSHALWKGSISFGGIEVPVKLHSAVKEERIQFHLLHRTDGRRLHQFMICPYEKKPVPVEEQIKGFETGEKGRYIIVDPARLEETAPEGSREIVVHEFVKSGEIDPLFHERAYNLEPDGDAEGYGGLLEVLGEGGLAGICTWTMRKRSYLGALQAGGPIIRLSTLRYADEIVSAASLELEDIPVSEREVKIGQDLIGQLSAPFRPGKFVNEHQMKLSELIAKKARGEKIPVLHPKLLRPTPDEKLLEALEASLGKVA